MAEDHFKSLQTMQSYITELEAKTKIIDLEKQISQNTMEKQLNTYDDVFNTFVDGFVLQETSKVKQIKTETLQSWFSNPDSHMEEIQNLLSYYYIIDGDIFQLYDMIFSLPKLDYKITSYSKPKTYEKDMIIIKQALDKQIKYKRLTRDLLVQEAHEGTVIGTWLGGKSNPYFYTFNDLTHTFPYGIKNGKMVAVYDLSQLEAMKEVERNAQFENLKPLITKSKYEKWKKENNKDKKEELQYIILPPNTSLVARSHTLYRNQRYGMPYGTASMMDIVQKQKMKDLEKSIADKVIKAIAVLKFKGKDDNDERVAESKKKKVFTSVKTALEKGAKADSSAISVIAMPDFANFEPVDFSGIDGALDPKKYESTDDSITNGTGIGKALTNGGGTGNYATSSINLEILYRKIAVLLEDIEEVFNQLISIVLGDKKAINYKFEFNKDMPLSKDKRVSELSKLVDKGYSVKFLLDELGINREEFIEESIYEIETLKLRDKIIPPLTSNVMSGNDETKPTEDNPTNENTITSKSNDGNSSPRAE